MGGIAIAAKRKTTTSTEVKERYKKKTYKRYIVSFRKEEDADLIDLIESTKKQENIETTEAFRQLMRG